MFAARILGVMEKRKLLINVLLVAFEFYTSCPPYELEVSGSLTPG
jgi:hypothetical protein